MLGECPPASSCVIQYFAMRTVSSCGERIRMLKITWLAVLLAHRRRFEDFVHKKSRREGLLFLCACERKDET